MSLESHKYSYLQSSISDEYVYNLNNNGLSKAHRFTEAYSLGSNQGRRNIMLKIITVNFFESLILILNIHKHKCNFEMLFHIIL